MPAEPAGPLRRPFLQHSLAVLAPLALTACQPAVLDPQGSVGIAEKTILINSLAIMLAIVVPDDRRHPRLRLVVPRLQHAGAATCRISSIPAASS